ncbi:EP300-interacting inhibitor of differentiation 3 [Anopheles gambiae]|uniref:Non-structural maintenance of chromosomes element 4 n=1 Tax=Anopheles coluzzii TaxID=1518534 RepID=A0A8W7NZM6_ANOCL|nr:EP300-interacting inhibitor of differentiation 3 [Anopheles coluzzii]XP_040234449.1 EP300-interacting inhibitor of differentiation 3 [Anopheles coluzzii]XP_061512252.1 EP300-interacting inhibitor of differentiation 3 [Anopheles gambiae]XP_061512253.1 EP300-interacting inhibitor of differentiation 3 [Anopheles gambiae]
MEPPASDSHKSQLNALERRKKYNELLDYGHELALRTQTEDAVGIFQGVSSILIQTDQLHQSMAAEKMENASEMCINVQVVKMGHDLVGAALQKSESTQFCDEELAAAIKAIIGDSGNPLQWLHIGELGIKSFSMSKQSPCLLGAFELEPVQVEKPVKERRRRQRQELGDPRKPETVVKLNQEETDARKLQGVMEQLKAIYEERRQPIPYFELITDPTDYMNTVDTAFQISFLIRDGAVALETVDDLLSVRPTSSSEKQQNKRTDDNVQAILSLNFAKWQSAVKQFRLKRPLLAIERDTLDASQAS